MKLHEAVRNMMNWPIIIEIPGDLQVTSKNRLSLNHRKNWRIASEARERARLAWLAAGRPKSTVPVRVDLIIYRARRVDQSNAWTAAQPYLDGCMSANRNQGQGVVPDDGEKWLTLGTVTQETGFCFKRKEYVELRIMPRN